MLQTDKSTRRRITAWVLGAAAAVILVVVGIMLLDDDSPTPTITAEPIELRGADDNPEAVAAFAVVSSAFEAFNFSLQPSDRILHANRVGVQRKIDSSATHIGNAASRAISCWPQLMLAGFVVLPLTQLTVSRRAAEIPPRPLVLFFYATRHRQR